MKRSQVKPSTFMYASDVVVGSRRATIAVHWTGIKFAATPDIVADFDKFLEPRPEISEFWFVFPDDLNDCIDHVRTLERFIQRRLSAIGLVVFRFWSVGLDGKWTEQWSEESLDLEPINVDDDLRNDVVADGLRQMFRDSEAVAEASAGFHFARPGGGHSTHFLRAGQAVSRTQHAYFLAMASLRFVSIADGSRLWSDTSGVVPALYALRDLVQRLTSDNLSISIDTFGGYGRYSDDLGRIRDIDTVFISSSTSGSLAERLVADRFVKSWQVITMFYLANSELDEDLGSCPCDLTNRDRDVVRSVRDARIEPVLSYSGRSGDRCAFCAAGSSPIELAGDGFFPVTSTLLLRMPAITDRPYRGQRRRPSGMVTQFDGSEYFADFYGRGAIVGPEEGGPKHRFDLSTRLAHLFENESNAVIQSTVRTKIKRLTEGSPPFWAVISLSDSDSLQLSKFVSREVFGDAVLEPIPGFFTGDNAVVGTDLEGLLRQAPHGKSVLVSAGVVASGRTLLALNRSLRILDEDVSVSYLVGVVHPESSSAWEVFQKTLGRRSATGLNNLEHCWLLPREPRSPGDPTIWDREREVLKDISVWVGEVLQDSELEIVISERIRQIDKPSSDTLFVSANFGRADAHEMPSVNPKFSLWPFEWTDVDFGSGEQRAPSQAEVLATVSHLLFESRRNSPLIERGTISIRRHGYAINPAIFDRFNEPQIQAAVLRASESGELDFQSDRQASGFAADIFKHMLENHESIGGEAAYEFALSLARKYSDLGGTGVVLREDHLAVVLRTYIERDSALEMFAPLLRAVLLYLWSKVD